MMQFYSSMRTLAHLQFQISQPSFSLLQLTETFEQSYIRFALRLLIFHQLQVNESAFKENSEFCLEIKQGLRFHGSTAYLPYQEIHSLLGR